MNCSVFTYIMRGSSIQIQFSRRNFIVQKIKYTIQRRRKKNCNATAFSFNQNVYKYVVLETMFAKRFKQEVKKKCNKSFIKCVVSDL